MYAAAIPTSLIIALLELRHLYRQFTNTPAETNKEPDDDNPYIYCQFVRAIAIGVPIAWALLLCGISLMFWMDIFDVQILAQTLVNGADSFSLLAIPSLYWRVRS